MAKNYRKRDNNLRCLNLSRAASQYKDLEFSVIIHFLEPVFEVLALDAEVSLVVDKVGDAVPLEELGRLSAPLPYADSYTGTNKS